MIIEHIFLLPGVGSYVLDGITTRDARVLEAGVLAITAVVIIANAAMDILAMVIDPRRTAMQTS